MKLIIQIPCYNEAKTLPQTIQDLPRSIPGISSIELQVIDDGSTDGTSEIARELGVAHIVRFRRNRGLAAAFRAGIDNALRLGADIVVNTDADNQYMGSDVALLVEPILNNTADMVIGCRPIDDHPEFSFLKKCFQKFGSWVLRKVSATSVPDAASGFRAYSRAALLRLNIFSDFSYTMETLIQAGYDNLQIASRDIRVNPKTRESRLFRNIWHYMWRSGKTIINIFLLYRSARFFGVLAIGAFVAAVLVIVRYLVLMYLFQVSTTVFWPSIILAGVLLVLAFLLYLTGILGSLLAANRKLSEDILYRLRKMEYDRPEGKRQ
ncbi:MAG: glycosyltransferase family 2 protein [Leptospirales bacterium]|nr:glycosyltransferase family 2 protein [Leptospirales bacterium]